MKDSRPLGMADCDVFVRERIIEAVATEVAEGGRDGLKLATLVLRAKVSKTRFYRIFESDGIRGAFRAMLESFTREVEERLAHAESLERTLEVLIFWTREHRAKAIAFLNCGYYEPDIFVAAFDRFAAFTGLPSPRADGVVGGIAWAFRRHLERGALGDDFLAELLAFAAPYFEGVEC